jgi:hypothetical protein
MAVNHPFVSEPFPLGDRGSMATDDQFEAMHIVAHQAAMGVDVPERHAAGRETLVKAFADFLS